MAFPPIPAFPHQGGKGDRLSAGLHFPAYFAASHASSKRRLFQWLGMGS
jgi:hypothetical protein